MSKLNEKTIYSTHRNTIQQQPRIDNHNEISLLSSYIISISQSPYNTMNQQYDPFGRPTNGAVPPNNGQTPPGQSPYNNYNNPGGYPPPGTGYQPPYGTYGQDPRQAAYFQRENRRRLALRSQKQELRRFGNCIGLAILAYFILQLLFSQLLSVLHLTDFCRDSA